MMSLAVSFQVVFEGAVAGVDLPAISDTSG